MASLPGWSQPGSLSNERELWLHNQKDSFLLSTLTIIPETFKITSDTHLPSESFRLDGNYFIWNTSEQARQNQDSFSFRVNFRVIPYEFNRWKSHFDSLLYKDGSFQAMESISFTPFVADDPLFSSRGIQYDGSFARGLSVGNSQDLVLNSNFDLRLNGSLGDGIEVLAALSDNSIPLQPEGNTQQLQEFDKIFIQLKKGGNTLTGGDFELSRPQSYFTNYFKKTQGVRVVNQSQIGPDRVLTTAASAGGSRGKFARIQVSTQEGNQGPYRLQGSSGERFIIILAGTEKIYLDGVLLVRGLERDYIIDYNSGELTFTANRIITKDTRIIAEYEYSDQNYNRSIYTFETDYRTRKFDFHFNAYSEQDGKLSSGITDLSTEDKRFLAELGDQTDEVLASSIRLRPEGYDPNIVMYKLIDSLGYPDILVRSTNPDSALYTARFTLVGDGKGDYIRIASESNGEVYAWVAPGDNGLSTGNYAPVAQLVAPQQRQMFAAGTRFDLGANGDFSSEVALSKIDLNRFSSKDAQDDYGYAISNSLQKTFYLSSDSIDHAWQISTNLKHEMLSKTFQPLNPYRPAEFVRDWNLNGLDAQQEHLVDGTVQLQKPEKFDLQYAYGGLFRKSIYQGNKHVLNALYKHKGFRISATGDWLKSTVGNESSLFTRPKFDLSQALDKEHHWQIGVYFEQEKNARRSMLADTLTAASFYYDLRRIYLRRANDENLNVEMSYQKRFDYFASGEDFAVGTEADDFSVRGRWARKTSSILDATLTLRNLDIKRINPQVSEGGLNYVGKINHQFNLFEGAIRTTTAYEIGSGQEPKRTYQYLKVDPGQGVYTFLDQNGDGI
ncbi:MAG: hypothetical protein KDC53_22170, partial [Saprospiraceae bacterium]|nr:hypothetical protein [Saprospiraceae bacterium]